MTDNKDASTSPLENHDDKTTTQLSLKEMKTFERWRKGLQYLTGLGMSKEEQMQFEGQVREELKEGQCKQCELWKDNLLKNSPSVRFMVDNLQKVGKEMTRDSFQCFPCDESRAGGFSPEEGVLLCANHFNSKTHQETTMVHEMVHMWDHHKFKVDWGNLRHHACSEVRAASLSGDCNWSREIQRGFYTFTKQHQACVKRRAILSVAENPNCKNMEEAERAVNSVFDSCFADTRPFDEIY
ncbi:metalloprotease ATP23 [Radiomyces spectabilis]|uniref:metalloprotease ATP23 n=1 Tax=Radiomyces spectabilis TaxID=64574 RepID=UPI00221E978A|nr:metalloprotease ATP23 [Radiomyces spectabilis]KAI8393529.1 metalloprotease ATP23 [Radiomyces spectabilis]